VQIYLYQTLLLAPPFKKGGFKFKDKDINIFIPPNNTSFVTTVSVFVVVLIILFLKPELFFMAFKTFLGNVVLLFIILGVSYIHFKYAIALALFFIILSRVAWT
jgi:hypothetical protein